MSTSAHNRIGTMIRWSSGLGILPRASLCFQMTILGPLTRSILEALTCLLQPGGIFVKNELYLKQLSKFLVYTAQIYFNDVATICQQVFTFGSNRNILKTDSKEHNIEYLYLNHFDGELTNHYRLFHDYQKSNIGNDVPEK